MDAGTIPDAEVDSAQFEVVPFAVETRVGERRTAAGIENRITCQVLDQVGEPITDIVARPEIYPDTGFERTDVGAPSGNWRGIIRSCYCGQPVGEEINTGHLDCHA